MTDGRSQTPEKARRKPLLPTPNSQLLTPYSSRTGTVLLPTPLDPGLLLAGLLALFVISPLLQPGLPGTADTPIHFYRALEFAGSWGPGVIYPRWAPDLAYGYGYPLWDFAPPLPYLIPLAFRAAGLSLEAGLKGLAILATFGYALGAYLLVRDSLGPAAGLVGAAVYTLAPFALREALLYGGNYPQYLAIGLYPWVLWALRRVQQPGGWVNVLLTAALYGAAILSHLFHALVLTLVAATFTGVLWLSDRQDTRHLGTSALALGLGLMWTSFFWLPAFVERAFTRATEDIFVSVSPFYLRFLNWGELLAWPQALDARAANPWVPFSLGPAALLLAALGLLTLLVKRGISEHLPHPRSANTYPIAGAGRQTPAPSPVRVDKSAERPIYQTTNQPVYQALFFLSLLAVCVFMMLPISNWVWANAPFLRVAEFPWRLLGLANLSLAFLGGASVHLLLPWPARRSAPPLDPPKGGNGVRSRGGWASPRGPALSSRPRTAFVLASVLAVLLSSAVYLYPPRPFVRYGESVADMIHYELATQTLGTTTLGEYLPRWVDAVPTTSPLAEALTRGEPVEKLDRASVPGGATARLLEHTAVSDVYRFDSPQPFRARFLTYYFPGWRARLDGQPVEIAIEPDSGLITVPVPAGSHELRLQFGDTPLRTASNAITGLTLAALALAGLWKAAYGIYFQPRTANRQPPTAASRQRAAPSSQLPAPPGPRGVPDPVPVSPGPRTGDPGRGGIGTTETGGSQPSAVGLGWALRPALLVGGGLLGLLLVKELVVDPQTGWFRRESPPGQVTGVQHPLRVSLDDRFWLLGYDLDHDALPQGETLRVVLYWQARRPVDANFRSFVHLDAPTDQRTWVGSDNFHPGDATAQIDIPTSTWDTDHYIRDEHFLRVPSYIPPVRFDLRAGLYDPATGQRLPIAGDGGDTIRLQPVQVTPGRGLGQADVPNPVNYRLGDHIRLLGYDWDPAQATLTLYWRTDRPLADDYVIFVHLLDGQGRLAWGADTPPLGGLYPTSAWPPGVIVADPRPLALAGLSPDHYTLAVGMYHPDTLTRLPVADADGQPTADEIIHLTRLTWP